MLDKGEVVHLIDVRSAGEYAAGHVPQAANVPLEQIESRLGDFPNNHPIALLCQSGRRAEMACTILDPHRDVLIVEGGTEAWRKEGLPTVSSATSKWSLERQVRLIAGTLVLFGVGMSFLSVNWIFLSAFVGAGLAFAGLTDICGMALLLSKLPWNQSKIACQTTGGVR